jgi:DNA-binding NarL/FixJ family response regulator
MANDCSFFRIVQGIAAPQRIRSVPSPVVAIAVAATDRVVRLKIAGALSGRPDFAVGSGASVAELIDRGTSPDLIVWRSEAARSETLELFKELKRDLPDLLIVAVLDSADARATRRLLDIGIDGLVLTDQVQAALPPTIDAALAGQLAVPRVLRSHASKPSLSVRERQILAMVVMGFTNGEIGARIFLAESTVKSHLSSAYAKLGVRSRSEAVALILDPQGSLGTGILAITSASHAPGTW